MDNNLRLIIITIFLVFSVKAENVENLIIEKENTTIQEIYGNHYYYMKFAPEIEIPNYLQIYVKARPNFSNEISISYYKKDSTFTDRKQLSTGFRQRQVMALNREQIKDGFYLSVECPEIILGYATYYYDINILKKDYIELTYGEQYTYYVTSDNKKMNFLINGLSFDEYPSDQTNFRISIWARGNKNVTSQLEGGNFTKHSRYNGYIIQLKERKDYNYFLTVEGTIGDLINVGAIDIGSEKNRFEYDIEYTGFLKRDIIDQITFCINIACDIYSYSVLYVNAYDYNKSEIKYEIDKLEYKRYVTIYLPKDLDELFFSFHYLTYESVSVEKITYSLRTGNNYEMLIGKSYTFGFIPK